MDVNIIRDPHYSDKEAVIRNKGELPWLAFPALERFSWLRHGFSTRLGGVSEGEKASLNLSFTKEPENTGHVLENYKRITAALGIDYNRTVLAYQTHTTNVRVVSEADCGKGIIKPRDYKDTDGLITDLPDIALVTFYADCVPLFFADPVHHAIGLSHSGWRGTLAGMGRSTIEKMREIYHTSPEDLVCCIGPSICQECYEIGDEVAEPFLQKFPPSSHDQILSRKEGGKYHLNLWEANRLVLQQSGVPGNQIHMAGTCTCCNGELFFSHRRQGENRGNLAAFLALVP